LPFPCRIEHRFARRKQSVTPVAFVSLVALVTLLIDREVEARTQRIAMGHELSGQILDRSVVPTTHLLPA
jgi:hypothetical protein